jgi:hypothetical protein
VQKNKSQTFESSLPQGREGIMCDCAGLTPAMGWSVNGIFCFYSSLSFFGLSELKVARQFGSSPLAEPRSVDLA